MITGAPAAKDDRDHKVETEHSKTDVTPNSPQLTKW
jgi:hypothetical protein